MVIQFLLVAAFILTPAWPTWTTPKALAPLAILRWMALALGLVAALGLSLFGVLHLRRNLTPLPYPVAHNRLVTLGVYALVRHPLYSSQLFAALGWTLYTLSLVHLALLVLAALFFDYKASKEEGWLRERHPEYSDYALRVRKFIPWIY